MLKMVQIEMIKELQQKGMGPSEIAERLRIDRKTVNKYMKLEDYNPIQPIKKQSDYKVNSADYLDVVIYQLAIDLKSKEYHPQRPAEAQRNDETL